MPRVQESLSVVQLDTVSLPLALGLWGMMLPVLAKVTWALPHRAQAPSQAERKLGAAAGAV